MGNFASWMPPRSPTTPSWPAWAADCVPFWWRSLTAQRLTLALWRPLAWTAKAFGVLPIRVASWPRGVVLPVSVSGRDVGALRCQALSLPRTLLLFAPLLLARVAAHFAFFRQGSPLMEVCVVGFSVAATLTAALHRRGLCRLLRCVSLYCARHPLPAAGWRRVLLHTVLVFAWYALSFAAGENIFCDARTAVRFAMVSLNRLTHGLAALRLVCAPAFLGQLAADLRRDGELATLGEDGGVDAEEARALRWRALLVRRRVLRDMAYALHAKQGACFLAVVAMTTVLSVRVLASELSRIATSASSEQQQTLSIMTLVKLSADLLLLVLMVHALRIPTCELKRMEEAFAIFSMKYRHVLAAPVVNELHLLMQQREPEGVSSGMLQSFLSGKNQAWVLISLIVTYAVTFFQNRAVLLE